MIQRTKKTPVPPHTYTHKPPQNKTKENKNTHTHNKIPHMRMDCLTKSDTQNLFLGTASDFQLEKVEAFLAAVAKLC